MASFYDWLDGLVGVDRVEMQCTLDISQSLFFEELMGIAPYLARGSAAVWSQLQRLTDDRTIPMFSAVFYRDILKVSIIAWPHRSFWILQPNQKMPCPYPKQLWKKYNNLEVSATSTESQLPGRSFVFPDLFRKQSLHYGDVIMSAMASQIASLMIVYATVYWGADQRKHQSSASMASVRGIHYRWIPHTKGQWRGKCFHLMTSSCTAGISMTYQVRILSKQAL